MTLELHRATWKDARFCFSHFAENEKRRKIVLVQVTEGWSCAKRC